MFSATMDSRIVVLGEPRVLDRLRSDSSACDGSLDCREIDDLLAPYDRETREGEKRLREMERVYSSLRGRVLVRLLVVDLNPESVKIRGQCPLEKAIRDWAEIDRRRKELLKERHEEEMVFVTVLVIEEGELGSEQEEKLQRLAGLVPSADGDTGGLQRVYLMTRLLELGKSEAIHATDVWPQFVAGLLRHFVWAASGEHAGFMKVFSDHGVFAWRTCRIMASINDKALELQTKSTLDRVNRGLLEKKGAEPLFPLLQLATHASPKPFEPAVDNAYEGKAWNELQAVTALENMVESPLWQKRATEYALTHRRQILQLAREQELDGSFGQSVVNRARNSPAELFPEKLTDGMPDFVAAARENAEKAEARRAEADRLLARLNDWSEDHDLAAAGFVTIRERIFVGLAVAAALCYSLVALCWVGTQFLPGLSTEAWLLGGILAGSALAGIALVLGVGYMLQRQRGMAAHDQLQSEAGRWMRAVAATSEGSATWILQSFAFRKWLVNAVKRALLRHRLWRVEQVVQNELQGLPESSEWGAYQRQDVGGVERYLEYQIKALDVSERPEEEINHLIDDVTREFLRKWGDYLGNDRSGRLFLPVAPLFRICRNHTKRLSTAVRHGLLEALVVRIQSEKALREEVKKELENAELFGNSGNLFSVDVVGGTTLESVYHREKLQEVFAHHSVEFRTPLPQEKLGAGVLAMWFGECRLRISGTDEQGRMLFVASPRNQ